MRKFNFNFFNAKNWPIFASFEICFPSQSIFLILSMNFSHWQNLWDTPDLVRSLHRHRAHHIAKPVAAVLFDRYLCSSNSCAVGWEPSTFSPPFWIIFLSSVRFSSGVWLLLFWLRLVLLKKENIFGFKIKSFYALYLG